MIIKYEKLRKLNGKNIVYTAGVFDLLHEGHVGMLEEIKNRFPDHTLLVGVMDDNRVKILKGRNRPVIPVEGRIKIIDSIKFVDFCFIYGGQDYGKLSYHVVPDKVNIDIIAIEDSTVLNKDYLKNHQIKVYKTNTKRMTSTTLIIDDIQKKKIASRHLEKDKVSEGVK